MWCRARFAQNLVQVNRANKLRVEIFSKLSTPILVSSVNLCTNEHHLNKTVNLMIDYEGFEEKAFSFNKNNPIVIEREFFVD